MPTLPTITVTDAQAQRMLAAYGSVDNYKKWLTKQIIEFVIRTEQFAIQQEAAQEQAALANTLRQSLGDPDYLPPPPPPTPTS